jgi:hypothetical protein
MLLQTSKTDVTQREMEISEISIYQGQGERPLKRKIKKTRIHKQRYKDNRHYTGERSQEYACAVKPQQKHSLRRFEEQLPTSKHRRAVL